MKQQAIFGKLEKLTNTKIPGLLKKNLRLAGFDNQFSLFNINSDSIDLIEKFVQDNPEIINNTKYRNRVPFKFDLGDRVSVLSFPKLIKQLNKDKEEKEKTILKERNVANFDAKKSKLECVEKINNLLTEKKIQHKLA